MVRFPFLSSLHLGEFYLSSKSIKTLGVCLEVWRERRVEGKGLCLMWSIIFLSFFSQHTILIAPHYYSLQVDLCLCSTESKR